MDKDREQLLNSFFKEFFTWKADNLGLWILAGIADTGAIVAMCIPYQNITKNTWGIATLLVYAGVMEYISPYIIYQSGTQSKRFYDTIKYLPVSLSELKLFRIKKVIIFCLKMFVIFLAGQLICSLICFHTIGWGNILYPLVCGLIIPLGLSCGYLCITK